MADVPLEAFGSRPTIPEDDSVDVPVEGLVWARGWGVKSDLGLMQLSPFRGSSSGPFDLVVNADLDPHTRYDFEGWLLGSRIVVTLVLPSDSQLRPAPRSVAGLRSWSLADYVAMLADVEAQPWFSQLVVGGVGDTDEETGRPLSDCLHVKYLTAEAIRWLGAQPPGGFQLWPMLSDDRSTLAP